MSETRLSKLPFALFWCLPVFISWFIVLQFILDISTLNSLIVAFIMYCNDIRPQIDFEMIKDEIRELEKDNTDLKADSQKHDLDIEANKRYGNLT